METAFMCGVLAVLLARPLRSVSVVAGVLAGVTALKAHTDIQQEQDAITLKKAKLAELKQACTTTK